MITQKQIAEFENVRNEIVALLNHNEVFDIVPRLLYLHKDLIWSARWDMSGYSLGVPTIHRLLQEFVWASCGLKWTPFFRHSFDELFRRFSYYLMLWIFSQIQLVAS